MNLKAMREAGIRKRLLRNGWMAPNHLVVHLMRPPGARQDVFYADVMGFQRVSGLADPTIGTKQVLTLDLIDVLRVTK